ncbi:MAG TPA: hypothetical protein K8V32_12420 [Enteractinococcus helveticum]|uniref:Uncharacterized protein n=1 Tax=Enteractinococcus helveticum TaxID=1837282 RepID=A0A921FPK6_9MICC|nr:hypothetical protein [Enteractinococcus helveticum]HJF15580.1 hypothetical protein [Enteractinococcus helveticum]
MTQYQVVMSQEMTGSTTQPKPSLWGAVVLVFAIAALIGLGIWVGAGFLKTSDSVTQQSSELTPVQHTQELTRMMRISAASNITLPNIDSIPDATQGAETFSCGSRFANAVDDAVIQLYGVDYLSTIGGARLVDTQTWRAVQAQAHDSAQALQRLFPDNCIPQIPVTFEIDEELRFAEAIGTRHMLKISDELIEEWSQLYLLAETPQQRDIALAGLWQMIQWESSWHPGGSPFAFEF